MELDDAPSRPNDALAELVRQDLDRLSLVDLQARISVLEDEIGRTRRSIAHAVDQRASADALFKR